MVGILTFRGVRLSEGIQRAEQMGCEVIHAKMAASGDCAIAVALSQAALNAVAIAEYSGACSFERKGSAVFATA